MNKKTTILIGLAIAAMIITATTLTATAPPPLNGPFNIKPGNLGNNCGGAPDDKGAPACDVGTLGMNYAACCNWAWTQTSICDQTGGNSCYPKDHYAGTCCYVY